MWGGQRKKDPRDARAGNNPSRGSGRAGSSGGNSNSNNNNNNNNSYGNNNNNNNSKTSGSGNQKSGKGSPIGLGGIDQESRLRPGHTGTRAPAEEEMEKKLRDREPVARRVAVSTSPSDPMDLMKRKSAKEIAATRNKKRKNLSAESIIFQRVLIYFYFI